MADAAAAAPAVPAAAAGGNSKKKFIIIGVVLVLLLGGLGGTYFVMKGASTEEEVTQTATKDAKGAKSAKSEKKKAVKKAEPKAAAIYIGFEPPFVVNFPADSAIKFLQLTVQIMTREATVEHQIKGNDPAIRDALLTLFGQQSAERLGTPEGKEELRALALQAVRSVIEREGGEADKVEAVYFTTFVMQ